MSHTKAASRLLNLIQRMAAVETVEERRVLSRQARSVLTEIQAMPDEFDIGALAEAKRLTNELRMLVQSPRPRTLN